MYKYIKKLWVMELAFLVTPGLEFFMLDEARMLVGGGAEISLFYSVTVLSLFGWLPQAFFFGLFLVHYEIQPVDVAITFSAVLWLAFALGSTGLLVAHIIVKLNTFWHYVVVLSLLMGSMVRICGIVLVPFGYFVNGDPSFVFLWWWLLCGIDWPNLAVSSDIFIELFAIVYVAQVAEQFKKRNAFGAVMAVLVVPMLLRMLGLSGSFFFRIFLVISGLVTIVYTYTVAGCAFDLSRVMNFANNSASIFDDIEAQSEKSK